MAVPEPKIRVMTTMPTLPLAMPRANIKTERLVLRPLSHEDLADYHALRTQPEVVEYMSTGRADRDLDETQAVLDREAANFVWGILLAATGQFIGAGGVHGVDGRTCWPSLSYYVRYENWGCGYASEAMAAVVTAWWRLPGP
ncbi:acyl-CoA n-acyltransferase [Fusarium bulbicola]|nr:acyl-CoA n-acyltransferase [Fusarium bulbicola]